MELQAFSAATVEWLSVTSYLQSNENKKNMDENFC